MVNIFIDGSEGTTGLRIYERFEGRDDINIMKIDPELRKDPEERAKMINSSDITFLCLPDAAARESVSLVSNPDVKIIDTSTAHRTEEGWAYGYPELSQDHRQAIRTGKRIAVPGCYATGFITIAHPLVKGGIVPADYPVSAFAVSGYSGAGKKTIAVYESPDRNKEFDSPREYALSQQFVSLPFYSDMLNGKQTPESIHEYMSEYFKGQRFIKVMPFGSEADTNGFIGANNLSGWDGLQLFVTGNEERILLTTRFDNLGKGASGAAIQCMNIMLGCDEAKGLNL